MSVRIHDCPSCGATLKFHSSVAVFAVCESCHSMVVRRDANVEAMGAMAELPPDLSPLKIGTRGIWKGESFELIGRLRLEWEAGSWSEWCAVFASDRVCWIAEAQGFLMVTSQVAAPAELPRAADSYEVNALVRLENQLWRTVDIKAARCIAVEGALPFFSPPNSTRTSIDLAGAEQKFATIELSQDGVAAFAGEYATFESLQFSDLRPVPGWDAEAMTERNQTITLRCPNCGAPVNLRAAGQTMSIVCGSCGSVIDTANPQAKLIQEADEKIRKLRLVFPIGTRGTLRGTEYEVIGFVRRKDPWASWDEYLLFNPWKGFRWLVTFRGHWSFVEPLLEQPTGNSKKRLKDGREFALYGRAPAEATDVLGEFYWKVQRGETAMLADYIQPPWILSMEQYQGLAEVTWSVGVYVESEDVAKGFQTAKLPAPKGIYLNQPNPHRAKWASVKWKAVLAILTYVVIQFAFLFRGGRHQVYEGSFEFKRDPAVVREASVEREPSTQVLTSPKFTIRQNAQPVWIRANAPVDNSWLELEVDLVNTKTNETFSTNVGIEYYHGYDEGSWSEGSQRSKASLPGVPAGEYLLNIEPSADPAVGQLPFQVRLESGGLFWSNFWLGLVLLLIYPAWVLMRRRSFEATRWSESDFSPYASSGDDE